MTLIERLQKLSARLEMEGRYVDAGIAAAGAEHLESLQEAAAEGVNQLSFCSHFLPVRERQIGEAMAPREQVAHATWQIIQPAINKLG